jgi:hypothetical protein
MRTSTRLAWPTLHEPILEPKSLPEAVDQPTEITVKQSVLQKNALLQDALQDDSMPKDYILTIRLKPEHIWILGLVFLIGFLFYALSLSWAKIALLEDALSMK